MIISKKALAPIAIASALTACGHPEDYRWSGTPVVISDAERPSGSQFEWANPSVAVYTFPTPSPSAVPASFPVTSLSDRGQKMFIQGLLDHTVKPDDLRSAIATPLKAPAPTTEGAATVEGKFDRTLVATVTKGWSANPGDRLVWTWVDIHPQNFKFAGYTVIATDNEVLNIEQIQNQTTASIQAQAAKSVQATQTATLPTGSLSSSATGNLGVTGSLSNQYTTSAAVNQQYNKLQADIVPHELRIYRESERNLDAAGNTIIALSVQTEPDTWQAGIEEHVLRVSKLNLTGKAKNSRPKDVTLDVDLEKLPPHCPLIADVTLIYELRRVLKGAESYIEGRQEVALEKHSVVKRSVQIVPADVARPASWKIYGKGDRARRYPVMAEDALDRILALDFADYEQARDFASWMNRHENWLRKDRLKKIGSSGVRLTSGDDGVAFPTGPFFADRVEFAADNAAECQSMNRMAAN